MWCLECLYVYCSAEWLLLCLYICVFINRIHLAFHLCYAKCWEHGFCVPKNCAVPRIHVVHHCRNSSVLSVLSALLALFRCACVSYFAILVQFFWVDRDFSIQDAHQKDRKEEKIKTFDVTFSLDIFWTTAWAFFNKIKSDLIDIFSIICVIFYMSSSLT